MVSDVSDLIAVGVQVWNIHCNLVAMNGVVELDVAVGQGMHTVMVASFQCMRAVVCIKQKSVKPQLVRRYEVHI